MERLGRYELIRQLGADTAEVWLARDTGTSVKQTVVLKRVQGADETFAAFFQQEMEKVAKLSHPNIVPVSGFGTEGLTGYWAVGYVPGHTLERLREAVVADGGPMALFLGAEVAKGLAYAHGQGVFHLGLVPGKIHVSRLGQVRVADFGIATIGRRLPVEQGALVRGEPAYMSPEQADPNVFDLDGRSDVFTLAVILSELLTGAPLFSGTPSEILHAVARFQLPEEKLSVLPGDLRSLLKQALVRDREQRVASATLLAERLTAALGKSGLDQARASLEGLLARLEPPPEAEPEEEESFAPRTEVRPLTPPAPRRSRRLLPALFGLIVVLALIAVGTAQLLPSAARPGDIPVAAETLADVVCAKDPAAAIAAASSSRRAALERVARTPAAQEELVKAIHSRLKQSCPEKNAPSADLLVGWLLGQV